MAVAERMKIATLADLVVRSSGVAWATKANGEPQEACDARARYNAAAFLGRLADIAIVASVALALFVSVGFAAVAFGAGCLLKWDMSIPVVDPAKVGKDEEVPLDKQIQTVVQEELMKCYQEADRPQHFPKIAAWILVACDRAFLIWPSFVKDPD